MKVNFVFKVEVCSGSLVDVLQSVVGGSEGCLFSYGHAGLGRCIFHAVRTCPRTRLLGMQFVPTDFFEQYLLFSVIITFFLPGKTNTMVGRDEKEQTLGLIPCALSWLFKLISEQKQK